ncbi:MAG: molybdopterin molybdotransferase MoeA [Eudoraea sp.]|nr:molybdopterin molybdotransferase MoeA [Eudoraea sp.]
MIRFDTALEKVCSELRDYGFETVPIKDAVGRVLAEDITADRDFPPFDRATKDGITINYRAFENGRNAFEVVQVLAAGTPASLLEDQETCMEIMTGAVVPYDADTVVMYEELDIDQGIATLKSAPKKGQNIHYRGSDTRKGQVLLPANSRITPAAIGILASVGKAEIKVKRLPRVAVISTGNELVEIDTIPDSHQIRRSNTYSLQAALQQEGIEPMLLHLQDDKDIIRQKLAYVVDELDVVLLSGGVSKGKYDYLPEVLQDIGVDKIFHGVLQRPGKPFWFGSQPTQGTLVFSFPGNPVSTLVNYHLYFKTWLHQSLGINPDVRTVVLNTNIQISGTLTRFPLVHLKWEQGILKATPVNTSGSGDLVSLAEADGVVQLHPRDEEYSRGEAVPYRPLKSL